MDGTSSVDMDCWDRSVGTQYYDVDNDNDGVLTVKIPMTTTTEFLIDTGDPEGFHWRRAESVGP